MAKKQRWIVTTPVVSIGYNHLRVPDTRFNADGDYKCDFFMTEEQAKAFCTGINKDPRAQGKKLKYTKVDGTFKFKTKQGATVKDKKTGEVYDMKPRLFYILNGETTKYPEDAASPWSGSTAEVEVEIVPYDTFGGGLTMRPRAVRLHTIVEGTKPTGNWADVDDGYSSDSKARNEESVEEENDELVDPDDEAADPDEEEVW